MEPIQEKINIIKQYWPQITGTILFLLFCGGLYAKFEMIAQKVEDNTATSVRQWILFNEKIDKTILILNDEDDGVRSDFGVGDSHIEDMLNEFKKYEELRSERDKLEIKVWYYENKERNP